MKISIIGASAGVGLATVKRALERGHYVTTLSRSDVTLPSNKNLKTRKGSAIKEEDLRDAIHGSDAVIVTLGTGKKIGKTTLFSDFAMTLLKIHKTEGINVPVIILSGFGASESLNYFSTVEKLVFNLLLSKVYDDKTKMETLVRASTLKWELVRPGILTDQALTQNYRVENQYYKGMRTGTISRNDVADYLVKQAENPTDIGKCPALFSR